MKKSQLRAIKAKEKHTPDPRYKAVADIDRDILSLTKHKRELLHQIKNDKDRLGY